MKNILTVLCATALSAFLLCSCSSSHSHNDDLTKVGMITDTGTIEDKSFNQGVWEGIVSYQTDTGAIAASYLQPAGTHLSDYLAAITSLHDTGHEIIVAPGFALGPVIHEAAQMFTDTTFILIDGTTHTAENQDFVAHPNTVCILFNEHEAGFLAGIAAALSTKTNQLGFIGGVEIPTVTRYAVGFKAGVKYANRTYAINVELKDENVMYQGDFTDLAAGQTLAATMYANGVDIVFSAAGLVGIGAINEAKARVSAGEEVWAIGVDSDQYSSGLLDNGTSVILTSAIKRVNIATYRYIDSILQGTFPGGEVITLTLADNAVGLPATNPNLAPDVVEACLRAQEAIVAGGTVVPSRPDELTLFL
ncbi:MAG: BMP family ABC transporter substrate-binding protein [Desulfuromonas sp.]|nr:BMP family ABC transporter substrate-binding protein [Desulfuromonas sp.]